MKDPTDKLDYSFNWAKLLAEGETITTSLWVYTGLTLVSEAIVGESTTIWLTGGTAETNYTVTNEMRTSGGRIFERSFTIQVREL